jgi:hypothetical protein
VFIRALCQREGLEEHLEKKVKVPVPVDNCIVLSLFSIFILPFRIRSVMSVIITLAVGAAKSRTRGVDRSGQR